ncbi:MAG TPA: hypothetical protein VK365_09045 [Nocardioidaceae bacterium]|nr:hypothetical protein [Nocardioidaceae bacterium]
MDETSAPDESPDPDDVIDDLTGETTGESTGAPDGHGQTGDLPPDPRVQAALARLARLDDLDVDEHVEVYDAVHRDLRDALAGAASRDPSVSG